MTHRHRSRRPRHNRPPDNPPRPAHPRFEPPADGHPTAPADPIGSAEPDPSPLTPDTWPDVIRSARPLDGRPWRRP